MTPLVDELLGCLDRDELEAVVRRAATKVVDETLDDWDDDARWRQIVTRFGRDDAQEAAAIGVTKVLNMLLGPR